jgi:hypothetical protein
VQLQDDCQIEVCWICHLYKLITENFRNFLSIYDECIRDLGTALLYGMKTKMKPSDGGKNYYN